MAVTVGTNNVKMTAQGDQQAGRHYLKFVRWVNATTAGHTMVLRELSTSRTIAEGVADGAGFIDLWGPMDFWVDGLEAITLQSGFVVVYYH